MNSKGDGESTCKRCGKKLNTGYPYCLDCMQPGEGPVMRIRNTLGKPPQLIDIPVKENPPNNTG